MIYNTREYQKLNGINISKILALKGKIVYNKIVLRFFPNFHLIKSTKKAPKWGFFYN